MSTSRCAMTLGSAVGSCRHAAVITPGYSPTAPAKNFGRSRLSPERLAVTVQGGSAAGGGLAGDGDVVDLGGLLEQRRGAPRPWLRVVRAPPHHHPPVAEHQGDLVDGEHLDVVDHRAAQPCGSAATTVAASLSASGVVLEVELTRGRPGGALAYSLNTTPSASRPRSRPPISMTATGTRSSTTICTPSGHLRDDVDGRGRRPARAAGSRSRRCRRRASCSPAGTRAASTHLVAGERGRCPRRRPASRSARRRSRRARCRRRPARRQQDRGDDVAPGQPAAPPLPAGEALARRAGAARSAGARSRRRAASGPSPVRSRGAPAPAGRPR